MKHHRILEINGHTVQINLDDEFWRAIRAISELSSESEEVWLSRYIRSQPNQVLPLETWIRINCFGDLWQLAKRDGFSPTMLLGY